MKNYGENKKKISKHLKHPKNPEITSKGMTSSVRLLSLIYFRGPEIYHKNFLI